MRSRTICISPASHRKAALNNDDEDEERAAHDFLQEGVERRVEIEDVEERADEENADQRPDNAADPACQLRSAKGDDRDRVELEAEAVVGDPGAALLPSMPVTTTPSLPTLMFAASSAAMAPSAMTSAEV